MELAAASVAANALRIGLNIATGGNRPMIEFYYEVRNDFGPSIRMPNRQIAKGLTVSATEHRSQRVFVTVVAANIGGRRAENLTFKIDGSFRRRFPLGKIFGTEMQQMAPGQVVFLLKLEQFDLFGQGEVQNDLVLRADYDAPKSPSNLPSRCWARLRKRSQYTTTFHFNGNYIATDLPPPNYA